VLLKLRRFMENGIRLFFTKIMNVGEIVVRCWGLAIRDGYWVLKEGIRHQGPGTRK